MMIHEITAQAGKYKARKRVGRGPGSGVGKRAGRGQKGAGSRSGNSQRFSFEGGQMPYFRRLPKMGFTNANFRVAYWTINLSDLLTADQFKKGGKVDPESLLAAGLVRDDSREIKVLGGLEEGQKVSVKFDITVNRMTASARKAIEDAGGTVNELGTRRDKVRGVDRNSDDHSPQSQTKKAKRRKFQVAKADAASRGEVLKKKS